jgi:fatty-acyl-CoA synthase
MSAPRRAANLASALTLCARRLPDELALVHGSTRWTWAELDARVDALAGELADRGVVAGECVLLDSPNHPDFIVAMYAAWRLGAVLAPVNCRLHASDVAGMARVCRPTAMIAHASTASHATAVADAVGGLRATLWVDGDGPDAVAAQAGHPRRGDHPVRAGDPAWYFFTSGTSGPPKAAVLTHDQLGFVVTNHLADLMPTTTEADRSLVVAPLSHGAGIHLLTQVARGAATVLTESPGLDPDEVWRLVEAERVSNVFTVPTILNMLVEHPAVAAHDHTSLRYVVYAGAPMAGRDQQRARAVLGDVLVQYYGMAEATGNVTVLPSWAHDHRSPEGVEFGTCGYPRTGMQVSIQDPDGAEVATGVDGEVCVAGPAVFPGYLDNPAATEAAFRDGWYRTGDVGQLDESGYLYLTGRLSDMYISGGSNVHPRDIEEKFFGHPDVEEVVVLGMPDTTWGEVGTAVVVRVPGSTLEPAELRSWAAERMARYKVPRHIVFWDELPRSGHGKIARRTVRQRLVDNGWGADGPAGGPR